MKLWDIFEVITISSWRMPPPSGDGERKGSTGGAIPVILRETRISGVSDYEENSLCMPRQEQDGKPEPPVISALFKSGPS